jgi:hypothetical protein
MVSLRETSVMKTAEKIDQYHRQIESINYDNREGGRYAYVQFMSLTREMLLLLQPLRTMQKQVEAIESINWVFNQYVGVRFTEHQRVIFDVKRRELKCILQALRSDLEKLEEEAAAA